MLLIPHSDQLLAMLSVQLPSCLHHRCLEVLNNQKELVNIDTKWLQIFLPAFIASVIS